MQAFLVHVSLFLFIVAVLNLLKETLRLYVAYRKENKIDFEPLRQLGIAFSISYIITWLTSVF